MTKTLTNRLNRVLVAVLTIVALTVGQNTWATEHTVTYTITGISNYGTNGEQITFTPSNSGFGTSGTKVATIQNISSTNGFDVQLDDGVTLRLSLTAGSSIFFVHSGDNTQYGISLNTNGDQNVRFDISCSNYYITHVKLAQLDGTTLNGTGTPAPLSSDPLDVDVDIDKSTYYDAHVTQNTNFGQLTITLSDTPRPYTITYVDAVDGVKYVTNTNPTTYNVATPDFQITAPTRTGYTFEGFYKNAEFSGSPEALPLTIERGVAARAKDRTFYAKWSVIPWGGDGSENTPYLIQYPSQLELLAANVNAGNDYAGTFFKLDADLPFSIAGLGDNESNFTAIGTGSNPFKGTFDGDSKTISGIRINKSTVTYQALFGHVGSGGTVKNVILNDAVITGGSNTGAIVGNNAGTITANYYHACSVNSITTDVGTSSGDTDGARSVHAITLPAKVTATGESIEMNSTTYYAANTTVTLSYSNLPADYSVLYAYNDGSDHVLSGNTFTMPAIDITVSTAVDKTAYFTHWQAGFAHDGSSAEKAYIITTPAGLQLLSSEISKGNNFSDTYFTLGGDIDMSGVDFTPIGNGDNSNKQFMGFFDGDGHTISHLTINRQNDSNVGLFGKMDRSSTISRITLDGANITGKSNVGGIAGYTENPLVKISNCHVVNSAITSTSSNLGAIVGNNSNGTLTGNTYHSTLVYAPETPINAFNIGCGDGDNEGACLDATQYFVNNRSDLAALLAAYYDPANHTAHDGTAPDLSQITAYVRENVTIPSGSVFEAYKVFSYNNSITLADGAQFIYRDVVEHQDGEVHSHYSLYVQKHIAPYTSEQNGWNLVSIPFTTNQGINYFSGLKHDSPDVYDLYRLNLKDNSYWENYKQHSDSYSYYFGPSYVALYASSKETTLEGNWALETIPETEEGAKVYLLKSEWNVTGNPCTFNAYVNRPYYRLNAEGSALELVENYWEVPVPVCGAVVMKANNEIVCAYDSVYFTRKAPLAPSSLDADKTIHSRLPAMLPISHGSKKDFRFITVLENERSNTAAIAEQKGQTTGILTLYDRVLSKDGDWNTLCLPFSMTAEQIAASPLAGADIRTLSSTSFADGTLTLNFTDEGAVTSITAGQPYIIKWTKPDPYEPFTLYDSTVTGRNCNGDTCSDIYIPEFHDVTIPADYTDGSVTTQWVDFIGITSPALLTINDKSNLFVGEGNTLYWPNNYNGTLNNYRIEACRAYFHLKNGLTASGVTNARMCFGDDNAASMLNAQCFMLNEAGAWYSLDGRKLQGKPTAKGVYIYNGKKIVIK